MKNPHTTDTTWNVYRDEDQMILVGTIVVPSSVHDPIEIAIEIDLKLGEDWKQAICISDFNVPIVKRNTN